MIDRQISSEPALRGAVMTAVKLVASIIGLAILVHMSWNMFAPDMFGLAEIRMKQALGLAVFAGTVGLFARFAIGGRGHG